MPHEPEVRIGHWSDPEAATGCTVAVFDTPVTASAEVRGGAPASRELALLAPERTVDRIDAVVLTGGSAFGLAAADGVTRYCEERGRGVPTPAGPVPIVPALALFDLAEGRADVRPGPDQGYQAAATATADFATGRVGAGTGATVGKLTGTAVPSGLGAATTRAGDVTVTAVVAVNSFGAIDRDGSGAEYAVAAMEANAAPRTVFGNTTIGLVMTNAKLDKLGCLWTAQGAHDGLARAIAPPHTRADGDAFVATASGAVEADVDLVRLLALHAVEQAIRSV